MKNPWVHLPSKPLYVLDCDRKAVETFNEKVRSEDRRLLVDTMMPEPFIGKLNAPVLLLSNNPGAGKGRDLRADPKFHERIRANLHQTESKYPFYYLSADLDASNPNRKWWERRVKWLIDGAMKVSRRAQVELLSEPSRRFSRDVVARSILNVVFFPYPSVKFGDDVPRLESQDFGFDLVRDAMRRDAFIVFMRTQRRWLNEIQELRNYKRMCEVDNVQNPTVSPTNLGAFDKVVDAIAKSLDSPT